MRIKGEGSPAASPLKQDPPKQFEPGGRRTTAFVREDTLGFKSNRLGDTTGLRQLVPLKKGDRVRVPTNHEGQAQARNGWTLVIAKHAGADRAEYVKVRSDALLFPRAAAGSGDATSGLGMLGTKLDDETVRFLMR